MQAKNNMNENTKHIQRMRGVVVSTKMAHTVVVEVTRLKKHPRYHKYVRETKRYKAHVESGAVSEGDKVTIELTRPISRDKHWRVVVEPAEENI